MDIHCPQDHLQTVCTVFIWNNAMKSKCVTLGHTWPLHWMFALKAMGGHAHLSLLA